MVITNYHQYQEELYFSKFVQTAVVIFLTYIFLKHVFDMYTSVIK